MTRLRTLTVSASIIAALTVPLGGSAVAAASPQAAFATRTDALVDAQRTDHHRVGLKKNACLKRLAQKQAKRMAAQERLFHQDLGAVLRSCGLAAAGENVASGYPDPATTVRGWMDSAGHRTNILNGRYRVAGVGAVEKDGRWYVAQVFGRKA